jgi:RND superfamily putative drug exporter
MTAITTLASTLGLSDTTGTLATMLGLACGIDYAVFVVFRYREERANGHTTEEAAGLAVGTAGSAVVFAGLTVVIALAGLSVVGIPLLTKMGLCAAGAVVLAVLIALTLVPALLGFWPRAVLSRRYKTTGRRIQGVAGNMGSRWAGFVLRHPWPVLFGTVVGLVVLALPALGLQLGQSGDEAKSTATTQRRAYDDLATAFGPGFNGPLTVVVDLTDADHPKAAAATVERRIAAVPGVVSVSPVRFNSAGNTALFTAVPAEAPTSQKTVDLVHTIRDDRSTIEAAAPGASFEVTGTTALNIDVAQKVSGALIPYLIVVVGLAVLLLLLVFRSIVIPIKAAVGFLLSVLAALGCVVAVFQWGWGASLLGVETTGPIMSLMPIFLVGIVFGLAMDYEVFLVSRIREAYVHGSAAHASIATGFRYSARVVTAAALIMISVFAGFITAGDSMIKMIGFGLAIAVLFDAFVVRMAFVPAVLAILGERISWLPGWLDRLLPNVDIEGESLSRRHPATEPAKTPRAEAPL